MRELLRKEHQNYTSINLTELQKNIDVWTEQEFGSGAGAASFYPPAKIIPPEYLTTTTEGQDMTTDASTESPTTVVDDVMSDEEFRRLDFVDGNIVEANQEFGPEYAYELGREVTEYPELTTPEFETETEISTTMIPTTTPSPPPITTPLAFTAPIRTTILPSPEELWNKLKLLLSPSSDGKNEKVYVVTPQPHVYRSGRVTTYAHDNNVATNFKSPRFLVRPTPGAATSSLAAVKKTTTIARSA